MLWNVDDRQSESCLNIADEFELSNKTDERRLLAYFGDEQQRREPFGAESVEEAEFVFVVAWIGSVHLLRPPLLLSLHETKRNAVPTMSKGYLHMCIQRLHLLETLITQSTMEEAVG